MNHISTQRSSFILVPGYWLGAWAWDAVATELRRLGHTVHAITLPGLDPEDPQRKNKTLSDQAGVLRAAVTTAASEDGSPVVLVAHSGAGAPASLFLDQDPAAIARVIYVDSGPSTDGAAFDASLPTELHELALPPFDQLPASLDGLSEQQLATFRQRAVPEPGSVVREPVHLQNEARRSVPTTIISCSYPSEMLMEMAREGHPMMAEVATLTNLEIVDLPTGHWPMWSRPVELAAALAKTIER